MKYLLIALLAVGCNSTKREDYYDRRIKELKAQQREYDARRKIEDSTYAVAVKGGLLLNPHTKEYIYSYGAAWSYMGGSRSLVTFYFDEKRRSYSHMYQFGEFNPDQDIKLATRDTDSSRLMRRYRAWVVLVESVRKSQDSADAARRIRNDFKPVN